MEEVVFKVKDIDSKEERQVAFRISEDLWNALGDIKKRYGIGKTTLFRNALTREVERIKSKEPIV